MRTRCSIWFRSCLWWTGGPEADIGGFRHKGLEEIYLTARTRGIGVEHVRKCVRVLHLLEVAERPENLNIAGFHFHGLQGNPKRRSVRVTGNYPITFARVCDKALDIDFEDYHSGEVAVRRNGLLPVHPGELIREDILPPAGLSVTAAAKALGVFRQMLHDILAGRKPLPAVMCLKVARLFGSTPELWMRLQAAYDLKKVERGRKVMQRVARIVPVKPRKEALA